VQAVGRGCQIASKKDKGEKQNGPCWIGLQGMGLAGSVCKAQRVWVKAGLTQLDMGRFGGGYK